MVCDREEEAGGGGTRDTESKTRTPHKVVGKKMKKNSRKIAIVNFFAEFLHRWKQKWWNMKKMKKKKTDTKMIKQWKKQEGNCNFQFFAEFLHHWKQKWWNMIKKNEKMI